MSHERFRESVRTVVLAATLSLIPSALAPTETRGQDARTATGAPAAALRDRLDNALDRWCRWLSGYLYQVPGTDLYTLNPTLGTGALPYRDIAGNQFAAAAAGYWLQRAKPDEQTARPLRGLIKLALGTHLAVKTIDRPDIQTWGAGRSGADNWHASMFAAVAGMLMLDALPNEQREQLRAILAWEADKHVEYGISKKYRSLPGRSPEGSVGESNAWTAALVQMARVAHPDSPRQDAWRQTAIDYSLNAICVPDDITADRVVAGKPLKARVKAANFEPGGIQEHHGFYHPGYVGWTLAYMAHAHLLDEMLPESQRNPDVYLNNWKFVLDRLKQGTFANGRFIYCAGADWHCYGYGNTQFLPGAVFAAAHYRDPDAMRLAEQWLSLIEQQQKLADGSVQASRLKTLQRLALNDFAWYEGIEGCCIAQALWVLDHVDTAAIPPASTQEDFHSRNVGTYHEPNARLVWHRDRHRWASFCWRSAHREWQAVVQPVRLPHLLKFNSNSLGIFDFAGTDRQAKLQFFEMGTFDEGGIWSLGSIDRLSKRTITKRAFPLVRQHQALIALPDGPSILIDQCQALDQLWLRRTGGLGLRLAADVFNDNRVNLAIKGTPRSIGPHPERDTWHDLGARSVTIEKLLAIHAIAGEGSFHLLQKRRRSPDQSEMLYTGDRVGAEESLLAHELYFGPPAYDRIRVVSPDAWFRNMILAIYCDPERTPAKTNATVTGQHPCFAIHLPDERCTVAVNFADTKQETDSPTGRIAVEPKSVTVRR